MTYVDGFVVPVPKAKLDQYIELANLAGQVWREHGALEYRECVAEDVKPGQWTSFPQSVKLEADEIVIFAWIVFESRQHRDEVNAKVMKDPRLAAMSGTDMPFDGKRLVYGGFETRVSY